MNLPEALDISIRFWRDMAEHGYECKENSSLYYLVKDRHGCPICEWTWTQIEKSGCLLCPLYNQKEKLSCTRSGGLFFAWLISPNITARKEAAKKIVDTLVAARESKELGI